MSRPHQRFLAFSLRPYEDGALPIRVTSLAPYAAALDATRPAYLETHRIYTPGYRATVNGRAVPVSESPRHLAMLPVPAGRDEVRLDFAGIPAVNAAYWFSCAAVVALAAASAAAVVRRRRAG